VSIISEGLGLANTLGKVALDLMDDSQRERLDKSLKRCEDDIRIFKTYVLNDDSSAIRMALDGLSTSVGLYCTTSERDSLEGKNFALDGYSLLGFYSRGRTAKHYREVIDIVNMAKDK
jgi:hypothetical protein